jgi:hypothetical protein
MRPILTGIYYRCLCDVTPVRVTTLRMKTPGQVSLIASGAALGLFLLREEWWVTGTITAHMACSTGGEGAGRGTVG